MVLRSAYERAISQLPAWLACGLLGACGTVSQASVVRPGGPPTASTDEGERLPEAMGSRPVAWFGGARAQQASVDEDAVVDAEDSESPAYKAPRRLTISPVMQKRCRQHRDEIERAGTRAQLDPTLLLAIAWVESGFNPDAVSPMGAVGIMQLKPRTSRSLGCDDPADPGCAAGAAAGYLNLLLKRFGGDLVYALCAYHSGHVAPSRAYRAGQLPDNISYVEKVLEARARLERHGCDGR